MTNKIKKFEVKPSVLNNVKINNSNLKYNNNFERIKTDPNDVVNLEEINVNDEKNINPLIRFIAKTTATNIVTRIKIAAGIGDVIEHLSDGVLWVGGKVVEGATFTIAQAAGLFDNNVKNSILDWREDAKANIKDDISMNVINEIEDELFSSELGKTVNDVSNLKYNSKVANTVENITKVGSEIVGATAATIATGGAASSTMVAVVGGLGFTEGAGEHAEKIYQKSKNTTGAQEVSIAFSGIANGASWVAKGLFGAASLKQIGNIGNIASQANSIKNLGQATKDTLTVHKQRSRLAYILRTRNEARSLQNVVDIVGSVFDTLSDSIDNNDSISRTGTKVGVGLATNIMINRLTDIGSLWARDLRPASNIAEMIGASDISLKKSIKSATQLLIEQVDTFIDSGFLETNLGNKTVDKVFDRIERTE